MPYLQDMACLEDMAYLIHKTNMKTHQPILVILFLLYTSIFTLSAQIEIKNNSPKKWTIENCVNHFSQDKTIPTAAGYQYWFADQNFLNGETLKMSVVAPGKATHKPHKHIEDEFFFVLEGTAKFYLDGDSIVSGQYTSFYCPAHVEHGIANAGETELKYLVIKTYEKK
jgi:mannose-6-phosphate isomerase-like protein (cupin superfamily)